MIPSNTTIATNRLTRPQMDIFAAPLRPSATSLTSISRRPLVGLDARDK
jgi:hypothetical protein